MKYERTERFADWPCPKGVQGVRRLEMEVKSF